MSGEDREEQYLLRVQDRGLAQRLSRLLREEPTARPADAEIELDFKESHSGTFTVGGEEFPVHVQNLPTIVESYKTYDDVHLVKSNDIGQMLLVTEKGGPAPAGSESRHGVTPPMRNARARHFRPRPDLDPNLVAKTEQDLLAILAGGAPDGVEYIDVEEEYIVDESGRGSWQPARPLPKKAPPAPRQKKQPKEPKEPRQRKKPGPKPKKAKTGEELAGAATPAAQPAPARAGSAVAPPLGANAVEEI